MSTLLKTLTRSPERPATAWENCWRLHTKAPVGAPAPAIAPVAHSKASSQNLTLTTGRRTQWNRNAPCLGAAQAMGCRAPGKLRSQRLQNRRSPPYHLAERRLKQLAIANERPQDLRTPLREPRAHKVAAEEVRLSLAIAGPALWSSRARRSQNLAPGRSLGSMGTAASLPTAGSSSG